MGRPLKSMTIVGGGTSGWLAASFLSHFMSDAIKSGEFELTVIESPNIPIIGVGEASSPALRMLLQGIGVNETKFIRDCNVAFKLSGYFSGWNVDAQGRPVDWVNPFLTQSILAQRPIAYYYLQFGRDGEGEAAEPDFSRAFSACPALIANQRGPRELGDEDYKAPIPYAYHMDAIKLAAQLRDLAKSRGVKHILDEVGEVKLDDRGYVSELILKERGAHPIEFVIDCTGFRGVIMSKALGEPFEPFDKYLANDRAAVVQTPHDDPTKIEPITRATALSSGWSFRVPLFNRVGNGYVYSSQFISDEDAVAELKALLGERLGDGAKDLEPRIIRMRIGKSRRSWVKNCLAIGLSSGFVEPLEATAIHSVDLALRWFYLRFPDSECNPVLQDTYNKLIDGLYVEMIDFIVLHYHLSNRTDSEYWRVAREERPAPDSLKEKLEVWRHKIPSEKDLPSAHFFTPENYTAALMGKGFYDKEHPKLPGLRREDWVDNLQRRRALVAALVEKLPGHYDLLRHIRGETVHSMSQRFQVNLTA